MFLPLLMTAAALSYQSPPAFFACLPASIVLPTCLSNYFACCPFVCPVRSCTAAPKLPEEPPVTHGVHDGMGTLRRRVFPNVHKGLGDAGGLPVGFRGR